MVESRYKACADKGGRAMAGLSLWGGFQTLDITFNHLDKFSTSEVSASIIFEYRNWEIKLHIMVFLLTPLLLIKIKLFFLGIGSGWRPKDESFSDGLTKAGIHNVYYEFPNTAHEGIRGADVYTSLFFAFQIIAFRQFRLNFFSIHFTFELILKNNNMDK